MRVLHDDNGRLTGELVAQPGEQVRWEGVLLEPFAEATTGRRTDVTQCAQRTWRDKCVARAVKHAHGSFGVLAERSKQRRLTDAGLARDENHAAAAGLHLRERTTQRCQ